MQRLSFGLALEAVKKGKRVARAGWNGKGQFVYMVPAASYPVQTGAAKAHFGAGSMVPYNAYLALKTVDETVSTWAPSVTDCLADDWLIVGEQAAQLAPHQQRVIDEKAQNDERLHKLREFSAGALFRTLSVHEQIRLKRQAELMDELSRVLGQRIEAFLTREL